jgi:phosphoesterase RecJ-like protein
MNLHLPELSPAFSRLLEALRDREVAVIGHARPDGDCIGSQVALARALESKGIRAVCVNPDPVPRRLRFLTGEMRFLKADDILPVADRHAAVFVDCADHGRAGERLRQAFPRPVGNIDHHLSSVGFAEHNLVDGTAAATCEILAGAMLDTGIPIDAQSAQALYTGILTDTGQFRFSATSRRSFVLAGELVARGADPAEAGFELYERESLGKLRLLQTFLSSLTFSCGNRVCIGVLHDGVFASTGTTAEDTEGLVDYARCVEGVEVGVLIEERSDGSVKASLRAKDPVHRLDRVAGQFNGGGHACAAGLTIRMPLATFQARLIEALSIQFEGLSAGGKGS